MRYIWNLTNNDFIELPDRAVVNGDYDVVVSSDGDEILVPRFADVYKETIQQIYDVLMAQYEHVCECLEYTDRDKARSDFAKVLDAVIERNTVIASLRYHYAVNVIVLQESHRFSVEMLNDRFDATRAYFGCKDAEARIISKTALKKIAAQMKQHLYSTPISEIADFYGLNMLRLSDLELKGITRIYSKAFVKRGVGFIFARILSDGNVTVVREGVSVSQGEEKGGAEKAEIELLRRIAASAIGEHGLPVEIVSSQLNIVNWLKGDNKPQTHLDARDEIMRWLEGVGVTARHMTPHENKDYRAQKGELSFT